MDDTACALKLCPIQGVVVLDLQHGTGEAHLYMTTVVPPIHQLTGDTGCGTTITSGIHISVPDGLDTYQTGSIDGKGRVHD